MRARVPVTLRRSCTAQLTIARSAMDIPLIVPRRRFDREFELSFRRTARRSGGETDCPFCMPSPRLVIGHLDELVPNTPEMYRVSFNRHSRVSRMSLRIRPYRQLLVFPVEHRTHFAEDDFAIALALAKHGFTVFRNTIGTGGSVEHHHLQALYGRFDTWVHRAIDVTSRSESATVRSTRKDAPWAFFGMRGDNGASVASKMLGALEKQSYDSNFVCDEFGIWIFPRRDARLALTDPASRVGAFAVYGLLSEGRLGKFLTASDSHLRGVVSSALFPSEELPTILGAIAHDMD